MLRNRILKNILFCLKRENRRQKLLNDLNAAEQTLARDPHDRELQIIQTLQLKQELEIHEINQAQGAQVGSRTKWIEEGGKNTKYFLRLEKHRSTSNTISTLRIRNNYTDTPTDIIHETKSYEDLYNYSRCCLTQTRL